MNCNRKPNKHVIRLLHYLSHYTCSQRLKTEKLSDVFRVFSPTVCEPTEVEWPFDPADDSQRDDLCRRKQHWLGLQFEALSCAWLLDSSRSSTVNQLERTEGSAARITDVPSVKELDSPHPYRQHHQPLIHQQARRHSVPASDGISNGSMELVPTAPHFYPGLTRLGNSQQDCRHGISTYVHQEPMANQTSSFSMDTRDLGASLCGPICRPYYASPNKVCLLASGSWRYPYGCVYDDVDQMAEPLHQSSLESNRQSTEQDLARTITSGDPGGSLLVQRDLVSPVEIFGNGSSSVPQQERYTCDDSINPSPSPQELEALRLAIISNKYSKNGLNDNATQDLLQPLLEPTATNRGYRKNQLRFLAWATAHNVFPTMFTGADVVNFLARLKHDHKLQLGTLKSIRTAIAHLHVDSRSISSHPLINTYLDSIAKQAPPVSIHKPQVDLTPSMVYARSIPSCFSTSVSLLQQKLAFLLAMAAFLRPSDLARIPFDSCKITPSDGCLNFKVVSPKERRKKRKIVKDFRVHPHQDKELCPAFCFTVLKDHPRLQGRTRHSALFVKANNINQPVLSSTISSWLHRRFISLSTTEPHVSIRSLASSAALNKGVDLQDIVTLGNWTSSDTFRQHYQRNHMADVNFTNTVLDHAVKDMEIFYDAEEDWTLD